MENMNKTLYATRALLFSISLVAKEQQHQAQLVVKDAIHGARMASTIVRSRRGQARLP